MPGHGQVCVLIRVFLGRFFEHEATAGTSDLRESFFWLIAALAAPGLLFAFHQQFYWNLLTLGPDGATKLRAYVLFDKTFYLTLTSVAMGLVSVAVWNALVVDRRDAFILGVLPVRRRAIVAGKLLSLGGYVCALNVGMHAGASLLFGDFLGSAQGWTAVGRGVAAHFIAASASGMFVFLSIVALVSACLALVGPRRFGRVAAVLQVLLVAVMTTAFLLTVTVSRSAVSLSEGAGANPWLVYTPPIWFLGVYETVVGTRSDVMYQLARTGVLAFASAVLAVGVFYPIACWRVLTTAAVPGERSMRVWNRVIGSIMVNLLVADSATRASLQFLVATASRVPRFRLVLSGAVGLGMNLAAAAILYRIATGAMSRPSVLLLAAPLLLTMTLVVGWRIVVAMPSELTARWVFRCIPVEGFAGRTAVRRITFVLGVLVPLTLAVPAWIALWGLAGTWQFVVNALLAGGILVEAHLWGFAGMPCTRPMAISDSNLQGRWSFYAIGLLACALGIPAVEVWSAGHWTEWLVPFTLGAVYCIVRALSNDAARVNVVTDYKRGPILLDLPLMPTGVRPAHGGRTMSAGPREISRA